MLVLTRQPNQSIVIGDDIVVTVLEVRGDQVRIGVRAPRSVSVHREEVYAAVVRANQASASPERASLDALGALRPPPRPAPEPPRDRPARAEGAQERW